MRRLAVLSLVALAFCTEQNRIVVHTGKLDDVTRPDVGDDLEIIHVPTDGYAAQKPGFYTVHDTNDWLFIWKDPRPDAQPPPPPRDIDWKKEMLFVATAPDEGARSIEVKKVIEQNSGMHVYVTETLSGPNCPAQANAAPPMDIVVVKSVPYDVHVHHDRVRAEECGPPPDAVVACRVAGSGSPGVVKLVAQTGQTIDCDSGQSKPRTGSLIDRGWQLASVPPGSTTKVAAGSQSIGITFPLDAWGTYGVELEVRDQARTGSALATIDAPAPETGVPIELHWTAFDRNDDASMFPRVELHVADSAKEDCGPATAKAWCTPKTIGTVQQIVLKPEPGKTYRAYVTYQDFRLKGSPIACVRTFPKGRPSVATCDDTVRAANATWEVGAIDEATTTIYDPKKGKPLPYSATTASDAGAPAAPDASAVERKNPF